MQNELVSIIVPVYNYFEYLEKCLKSIVSQDYSNIEILIIDDGSTDGSEEICERYEKEYSNIFFYKQNHKGVVSARELGLENARGDYVTFVDSDDWIEKNHISKMISYFDVGVDLIAGGAIREDYGCEQYLEKNRIPMGKYIGKPAVRFIHEHMLCCGYPHDFGLTPYLWNKMYRTSIFKKCYSKLNNSIYIGEDVVLNCMYCLSAQGIILTDNCTYHYIGHNDSQKTRRDSDYFCNASQIYVNLYNEFMQEENAAVLVDELNAWFLSMIWSNSKDGSSIYSHIFFPFRQIEKDKDIVLYGAGKTGRIFFEQIKYTNYCSVITWVDGRAEEINRTRNEVIIDSPDIITKMSYDYIVIASFEEKTISSIKDRLFMMGVPSEKIVVPR